MIADALANSICYSTKTVTFNVLFLVEPSSQKDLLYFA